MDLTLRFDILLSDQFTYVFCRNLESNGLSGRLPPELGNLRHLEELRLDRNRLEGTVPGSNTSSFVSDVNGM